MSTSCAWMAAAVASSTLADTAAADAAAAWPSVTWATNSAIARLAKGEQRIAAAAPARALAGRARAPPPLWLSQNPSARRHLPHLRHRHPRRCRSRRLRSRVTGRATSPRAAPLHAILSSPSTARRRTRPSPTSAVATQTARSPQWHAWDVVPTSRLSRRRRWSRRPHRASPHPRSRRPVRRRRRRRCRAISIAICAREVPLVAPHSSQSAAPSWPTQRAIWAAVRRPAALKCSRTLAVAAAPSPRRHRRPRRPRFLRLPLQRSGVRRRRAYVPMGGVSPSPPPCSSFSASSPSACCTIPAAAAVAARPPRMRVPTARAASME